MSKHNKNNLNEDGASSWACTASGWVDLDCCLTRESREPPDSLDGGYGLVWECLQPVTVGDPDSRLEWPFWTSAEVAIPSVHQVSPPRSDGVYSTSPRPFHATHPQILGICRDNDIITAAPPPPTFRWRRRPPSSSRFQSLHAFSASASGLRTQG
jgi:hypothetical protein